MYLLPSEQNERVEKSLAEFERSGELSIFEPCDCGSQVRHNNGGNYHDEIYFKRDSGKIFVKNDTSCELVPPARWEEISEPEAERIIRANADWL